MEAMPTPAQPPLGAPTASPITALLNDINVFCRTHGVAESTFGRLAVNDGKFVSRLRDGGRLRAETLDRVREFMRSPPETITRPAILGPAKLRTPTAPATVASTTGSTDKQTNFRFYDNRQKYLLFVNTCGEKSVIGQRIGMELPHIHPRPPAVRVFDAGVGDGTVLSRVMRDLHHRHPTMPFYIVGKEISVEDVRLTLDKMADRFFEHPATCLVLTNMYYSEAPWLNPKSVAAAGSMVWNEVALTGTTSHEFETQISALAPFLSANWTAHASPTSGNPLYDRPVALVIYRDDYKFLMHDVIPKRGAIRADYDLVLASQPYRLRVPAEFKAQKVLAPLARSLGPGGRLIGIHSRGGDPGHELIREVWPEEDPYRTDRHTLLRVLKAELGNAARGLNFNAYTDQRAVFRYDMHTLPTEIDPGAGSSIGTSTLFAAWNAAVYVAQIEDQRLAETLADGRYLKATQAVLQRHGGLWFLDESFVVSRARD